MSRRLRLAGLVACLPLSVPFSLAAQDVDPPVLTAFDFSPRTIDTSSDPQTVTVNFTFTDGLSGLVGQVIVEFVSPSGAQIRTGWGAGCAEAGTICTDSAQITFPPFGEAGVWSVRSVHATDVVGNRAFIDAAALASAGFPYQLTVISRQDVTPPFPTAFDFSPRTLDTTSAPARLTVNFAFADDLSGLVGQVIVSFRSPSGVQLRQGWGTGCAAGSNPCTDSTEIAFPQFGEAGVWKVAVIYATDLVGNRAFIDAAALEQAGFPTELTVISNQDVAPPVLTAFDFSPKSIDTSAGPAKVGLNFTLTDDLSGLVGQVIVEFISPSGSQIRTGWGGGCTEGATTCTDSSEIPFPQSGETGIWKVRAVHATDVVGNGIIWDAAALNSAGFSAQLLDTHQAVVEPILIRLVAGSTGTKSKASAVKLQAYVQNIGNLDAPKVPVGFEYSADGGLTFSDIGAAKTTTLAPGATGLAEFSWKAASGTYLIRVRIDADNRIPEYSESNNESLFSLTVQ